MGQAHTTQESTSFFPSFVLYRLDNQCLSPLTPPSIGRPFTTCICWCTACLPACPFGRYTSCTCACCGGGGGGGPYVRGCTSMLSSSVSSSSSSYSPSSSSSYSSSSYSDSVSPSSPPC